MESLQAIKNRIQGIRSTRQITQSMRLVSTSKVQRARARMEANRPFLQECEKMLHMVAGTMQGTSGRYVRRAGQQCAAVIVIGSDRGLCGGYNINVNKEASRLMKTIGEKRLVTVGTKTREYFRRRNNPPAEAFTGMSEAPYFDDAVAITSCVLQWYNDGEVDAVYVVHTGFESMLKHNLLTKCILPLEITEEKRDGPSAIVRCEPEGEEMLRHTAAFYLATYLYGAILEASCCEQSARIASMDSAVKNADEMVETLTLRYNQARQGAITQEIIEIVGGANAV